MYIRRLSVKEGDELTSIQNESILYVCMCVRALLPTTMCVHFVDIYSKDSVPIYYPFSIFPSTIYLCTGCIVTRKPQRNMRIPKKKMITNLQSNPGQPPPPPIALDAQSQTTPEKRDRKRFKQPNAAAGNIVAEKGCGEVEPDMYIGECEKPFTPRR